MFQKKKNKDFLEHKLEHHIIQVLKFGLISHMIQNVIYGHWVACINIILSIYEMAVGYPPFRA